jgi:hypothetical protein
VTWICPYCGRKYPDSSIGVPRHNDADTKEGCTICWVSPAGTGRYVRPDSTDDGGDTDE